MNARVSHVSAESVARVLQKARRTPSGWKACCPAHEDKNPSLFIGDGDGRGVALVCYAGCSYRDVAEALRARGLDIGGKMADDGIPDSHYQLGDYTSHWDYRDKAGNVILRVCRWEQPGGKKEIRPLVYLEGQWKWAHHPAPMPLYNRDRLENFPDSPVLVVEGEKTAAAAQKLFPHYVVTTWPGGAQAVGKVDWSPLKGRTVVAVPDNDMPGRKAMAWVGQQLQGAARDFRIADPAHKHANLPEGWDIADAAKDGIDVSKWLDKPADELPRLIKLGFNVGEAKRHLDLPYLVKGMFDRGQIIVLWGSPGSGKTFLCLHLSAHIGAGQTWEGRRTKRGKVLYVCAESTRARLENRVSVLVERNPLLRNADVVFCPVHLDLLTGAQDIEDVLAAAKHLGDCAMIVIDTLSVTFGGGDENSPEDMGLYVANVKRLKEETGAAVLIVHHAGKDEARGMRGHSALLGALDAELIVERQDVPPDSGLPARILKTGKVREGLSNADVFAFNLEPVVLGKDADGDDVTTCVVTPSSVSGGAIVRRPSVGSQNKLLQALEARYRQGERIWTSKDVRAVAGELMHRNSVVGALNGLVQTGFLLNTVGGMTLGHPPE